MLRASMRAIALKELNAGTVGLKPLAKPALGWLRAVRDALGLSRNDVAKTLRVTPAAVRDYEAAEADDKISVATLRRAAGAVGCELVIAFVPQQGLSFAELARRLKPDVHADATEHSMRLEGQGTEDPQRDDVAGGRNA